MKLIIGDIYGQSKDSIIFTVLGNKISKSEFIMYVGTHFLKDKNGNMTLKCKEFNGHRSLRIWEDQSKNPYPGNDIIYIGNREDHPEYFI